MKTTVITVDPTTFHQEVLLPAAMLLKAGELVAFPTETVYGLGAVYNKESAVKAIFTTKGRPGDNPLILHIWDNRQLEPLVTEVPSKLQRLMEAFWPGPLTLIFPKSQTVPTCVTGGLNTVAIRQPSHPVARELLRLTGVPVAAPSANLSGKPSPTKGAHVLEDFDGKIPLIIDAGPCEAGLESTVAMLDHGHLLILRPGFVTREMLEEILGEPVSVSSGTSDRPMAPGMKYRHYAPKAPVTLVEGPKTKVKERIGAILSKERDGQRIAVIGSTENLSSYRGDLLLDWGSEHDLSVAAMRIYDLLRRCDQWGADHIIIEGVTDVGIGAALKNRLYKAAGGNVIHVS